ncbi:MAG: hypothetical protein ACRDT9_06960 [Agromyces sp.]
MHNLASEKPDLLKELISLWYVEAGKYDVLPLDDRTLAELIESQPVADIPPGGIYRYSPGTSELPEFFANEIRGRSFKILARVDLTDEAEGVLYATGSRFGGHSLFIKDHRLWYVNNFIGIPPEQQLVSPQPLEPGAHVLGAEFVKTGHGERGEATGTATLWLDDQAIAESQWRTQPGHFSLVGEGLTIGRDSADPVSSEYPPHWTFSGGTLEVVEVSVGDDAYVDLERDLRAGLARD